MAATDEADDIQAIVDRGFGSLAGASFLLLWVGDKDGVREWLRSLKVTSLADALSNRLERVCQLAFTAPGLAALGFDPARWDGFAPEFLDGMARNARKSAQLGDTGDNAPDKWEWGAPRSEPHVLVMLLAPLSEIESIENDYAAAAEAAGCERVIAKRSNGVLGTEPFGFADGLSQPDPDWQDKLRPGSARDRVYRNCIAAGEFLLGHPNEYGFIADYPAANELGRNGTYLVYRQLEQDVAGFWTWLAREAGTNDTAKLAELMVGRRMDGDPLASLNARTKNDFTYVSDADGMCCPIGAHIRRANPRSGDDPQGDRGFLPNIVASLGLSGTAMHDAVASARFHRLMRRGRSYGPVIDPVDAISGKAVGKDKPGLHFICINASLARQFEFVQGAWLASAYFAGMSCEQDPLLGNRLPDNGGRATDAFSFTGSAASPRLLSGLPQFVTVKGGAYFFLPGIRGLGLILAGAA